MKKNFLVPVIAGIVFIVLLVAGIFTFSSMRGSDQPYTPKETSSSPSTTATVEPTPTATASLPANEEEIKSVKDDSKNFEDVKAVDFFTEAETKEALQTAYDYAESSLSNKYFLSGQWAKDGFALKNLDASFGQFYSKDLRTKINAWDDSNGGVNLKTEKLLPLVFYVADNGEIEPSKYCAIDNDGTDEKPAVNTDPTRSCPAEGLTVSDMKYESIQRGDDKTPGINIAFTATTEIPVTIKDGNKDAKMTVTYDYIMVLVSNNYQEDTVNPKHFVINEYDIKVTASKVTPINAD